jgi:uncharacterized spore protein YtfJ
MSEDLSRVLREAQEAASGPADSILETLASRVGVRAGAHAAFGEPVDRDGVTVIPVAKVRFGFGGGSGRGVEQKGGKGEVGEGSGGGGGAMTSPLGFIEIKDGQAEFKRTHDPISAVPVILAAGLTAWLVLRGLKRLVRG